MLLIPSLCWSATGDLQTIGGKVDTAITSIAGKAGTAIATVNGKNYTDGDSAGDSCTGNLKLSHWCENNDDATVGGGCSASEIYKSWTLAGATYDNTAGTFSNGSYSLKGNGYNDQATITNTGNWLANTTTGCVKMSYKPTGSNSSTLFEFRIDDNNYIKGEYDDSTDKIVVKHDGASTINSKTSTATFTDRTIIMLGWDASPAGGSQVLQVKVGDNAWETTSTYTFGTLTGTMATELIGTYGGNFYGNIDGVQIWSSVNCQ